MQTRCLRYRPEDEDSFWEEQDRVTIENLFAFRELAPTVLSRPESQDAVAFSSRS